MSNRATQVRDYIDGLRQIADFLEAHEDLCPNYGLTVDVWAYSREEFVKKARVFGAAEKKEMESYFLLRKKFGPHKVDLTILREEICTRVQVGTRTVSVPDPEVVAAAPMVEREEPVYEWECPDSVLKEDDV